MVVTDAQVLKLRTEMSKHDEIGLAATRSGMDRKTARKYLRTTGVPSSMKPLRNWRTRKDPFAEDWAAIEVQLKEDPETEAVLLFEDLLEANPERYQEGQLRTLQRRIRRWRAEHGPDKRVFFVQRHRPGEAMQTDFTWLKHLGITIAGEEVEKLLCHSVLPYSNWQWGTLCNSESLAAIKRGVQASLRELGRAPKKHQTDNSTAATHRVETEKRDFNDEYVRLMKHYGMDPQTIAVGEKEQNGDIEAANGAAKRRIKQELIRRGSKDFASESELEAWIHSILRKRNLRRRAKVDEELALMHALPREYFPEYCEVKAKVLSGSTISVRKNVYSVPSRLIGETVRVRIYDDRLEVYYAESKQFELERIRGEGRHRINYRHVIHGLVRRPGAFERYRYRDDLFPSDVFRWAHERLHEVEESGRRADIAYLRLLKLAAETMESRVESAIETLRAAGEAPAPESVKAMVAPDDPAPPVLSTPEIDLGSYDELLTDDFEEAAA